MKAIKINIFLFILFFSFLVPNCLSQWVQTSSGMGNISVLTLAFSGNYFFAGTDGSGVYRRPLSELTSIQPVSNEIPNDFSLSQNYPNPFNPVTKIKFDIPSVGQRHAFDLKLVIYDVLGREITTLVNEQLKPGTYEVEWDAAKYPSGVYYYKLTSTDFTGTQKMILVK